MPTITHRNDTYKITVSCGYDTTGKQIRRHMTWKPAPNMTKKQIEKELQRQAVLFEEQCQGLAVVANIKFQTFAEQWFADYAEKELKAQTVSRYKRFAPRTYAAIGHLRLDRITSVHIQKFINNLGEDGVNQTTGGKLSPKTIHHYLSFVSTIFNYAVRMHLVKENPCRNVYTPKQEQVERDCYTLEEAQQFLDLLQYEPLEYQSFFTLAIYGGFRKGELLGLEWKDIDFESGVVSIRRTSLFTKENGVYTDTPKTKGSQRSLKLPVEVLAVLRKYRAEQNERRLKMGDQWHNHDRLFTAWNGEPMGNSTPYHWLLGFCERTGMRRVNIHSFRHLNASLLINSGVDVRTVSASLGHSNTSTTLNIYAHTFAEAQAKASEAVANALDFKVKKQA